MSSTEGSVDLDSRPVRRGTNKSIKEPRASRSVSVSSSIEATDLDVYGEDEGPRKKPRRIPDAGSRLEWSDSDGENAGAAAYQKFKSKGTVARKRALASTRRAKAIEVENNPSAKAKDEGHTGVGRQGIAKKKISKVGKYDDVPSEEDGMEWTMPDYVQDRRVRFDERSEKLKEAGLMLPPTYDDIYFSDNERIKILKERPYFPHVTPPAPYKDIGLPYSLGVIPAPIAQYLRDYQVKGVAFLHELFVYQKGGILGDDMGLGKTIQVIAFLTAAYGKTGDERDKKRMRKMRRTQAWYPKTLIICPGSLMANWQDEFRRWGWWHTDLFHGSTQQKDDVLAQAKSGMLEVMITTYTTYRLNKSSINTVAWDCVVADECHIIKERRSEITKAMNEVNALCRIGLTGTAIQNKYDELWTILNFSSPGRFGPISQWKVSISEPLKLGQSHNATVHELARARKTAKKLAGNLLPQFFLRRMKTLIKDQLPKKTDRVVFCPLTSVQVEAYRNFLESDYVQTIKASGELCACGSGKKSGWCCYMTLENGDTWQQWVFPAIQYLQRLSNHIALLIPQSVDSKDKQAKDLELLQTTLPDQWKQLNDTRDSILNYANPDFCGKWRVLRKLLKFWFDQGGNKVLVFSHSVKLLKMLQQLFISTSYNVKYLDGSMTYDERYLAVKDFNSDPTQFVFLISTRAGGVGLNITSANKVVVVDPNWNPSYDLQAQDRAYRIGQTRDVEVFRLVSQGTLEEIVYARQIYKQQMSNVGLSATSERRYFTGVQGKPSQKGEIFGLQNLFAYQDENVVLRDIVHKTNVAESRADLQIADLNLGEEEDDDDQVSDQEGYSSRSDGPNVEKENAAMSQLVAEITGVTGTKPKKSTTAAATSFDLASSGKRRDAVQAILASAGVSYTHENSEVVGSSRVEAALSRRAEGASSNQQQTRVFLNGSQSQERYSHLRTHLNNEGEFSYRYRPPGDVKQRQFCSMAKWAGHDTNVVEFALLVESWTQAQRREFLEKWYRWRRDCIINGVTDHGLYLEEIAPSDGVAEEKAFLQSDDVAVSPQPTLKEDSSDSEASEL
ncbi:hypothetical protein H2198_001708 [Neophaeococcomyces mojaviensis]|uniref:Uncharacterized protein n=1 Tax=Neophaeococcomyces mojaviensis TaxID=3383035 RepID=A0ACC3AGM6_9EURO|nr:hypothetical protein H2198_001708 [Knufia sp. JES_112]